MLKMGFVTGVLMAAFASAIVWKQLWLLMVVLFFVIYVISEAYR
jgi:hypothetical protein